LTEQRYLVLHMVKLEVVKHIQCWEMVNKLEVYIYWQLLIFLNN
jgi:hypothetical protein